MIHSNLQMITFLMDYYKPNIHHTTNYKDIFKAFVEHQQTNCHKEYGDMFSAENTSFKKYIFLIPKALSIAFHGKLSSVLEPVLFNKIDVLTNTNSIPMKAEPVHITTVSDIPAHCHYKSNTKTMPNTNLNVINTASNHKKLSVKRSKRIRLTFKKKYSAKCKKKKSIIDAATCSNILSSIPITSSIIKRKAVSKMNKAKRAEKRCSINEFLLSQYNDGDYTAKHDDKCLYSLFCICCEVSN